MRAVLLLWAAFAVAALVCERLIRDRRLQSALPRVVVVHGIALATAVALLVPNRHLDLFAVVIFWSGGFLAWFGLRSHLESSILLQMIHSLRGTRMSGTDLVAAYEGRYGEARRLEELVRAGLVSRDAGAAEPRVTRRGALVVRLLQRLR